MPAPEPAGLFRLDELAHAAICRAIRALPADIAPTLLDATAGNGHDTRFLAELTGQGTLYAFDVQESALAATRERLQDLPHSSLDIRLILDSHAHLTRHIRGPVHAALFNLGFLPGSDKTITTQRASTLAALRALEPLMAPEGLISAHLYTGHAGGLDEAHAVLDWAAALPRKDWYVLHTAQWNKPCNMEHLLLIACRGDNPSPIHR